MLLRQIIEPKLAQYSYLIGCRQSRRALLVDPLRDIDRHLAMARDEGLDIVAVAETHIHADFLSGAREFSEHPAVRIYLSDEGGPDWRYGWPGEFRGDTSHAEIVLLHHGDTFTIGSVELLALHTPGHTPEHLSYLVTDRGGGASTPVGMLSGDFVLVGDLGRPDLLEKTVGTGESREASARDLYRSIAIFTALEDDVQLWPGHGAGSSCGKSIGAVPTSTVGYEKRYNRSIAAAAMGEDAFVAAMLADQPTPPTYFARMKRENRDGPPPLRRLPRPRSLAPGELQQIARHGETVVIDSRRDRSAFMAGHLRGSLYAPFDRSFSTVVGSLLVEPTRPIVLLAEPDDLNEAVRDLVRIGYDRIVATFDPPTLADYLRSGGEGGTIGEIRFGDVPALRDSDGYIVVDVRDYFEFADGHIPGAINAPHTRLPEYLGARIPRDRPLIVHCESGARSATASAWLAAQGRDVLYVNDDWSAWADAGRPIERGGSAPGQTGPH